MQSLNVSLFVVSNNALFVRIVKIIQENFRMYLEGPASTASNSLRERFHSVRSWNGIQNALEISFR